MIIGFSDGTEGVLEVVKAEDVEDAREYITGRYPVAADLFNPDDQLLKSQFVLYDDVGHGLPFPAPAGLDWADEGEMIHKIGLIRFSTDEQAETRDLDAPQNNNMIGQAGGRRRSRRNRRNRKAKRRGTRHRK